MTIAVIGAGLAGAAAGRALKAAGAAPVLFDKGRGPGGRLSTRRAQTPLGEARFDHGAQYVTAHTESFSVFLQDARAAGAAALWDARLVSVDRGGNEHPLRAAERYVGVGGMSTLVKHALAGLDVQLSRRAAKLTGAPGDWTVHFEDGSREGPFEAVALTLPPEQLTEFLARSEGDFANIIAAARGIEIAPCWTAMAVLDRPFGPDFDGAKIYGGAIRWMARMAARPGFPDIETVVLQASPDWSRAFLEETPEFVAGQLCEEAFVRFAMPVPVWSSAHRWRYSMVEMAAGSPAVLASCATVGAAGDWRLGGKAEEAWTSGEALAQALVWA